MATATTYTKAGIKSTTDTKLDPNIFAVIPTSHVLLKEAYVAYLANGRKNLAVSKTRGEVSGGGRKPWKQKGTGRARFGSSRVPIWRGGGIVFGPTGLENYTKQLNVKAKRLAVRQALSIAASENRICIIESLETANAKTAEFATLLKKVDANRSVLISVEDKSETLLRASRNLSNVKVVQSRYLNVYDIMNADRILFTLVSLKEVAEWLTAGVTKAPQIEGDKK